MPVRAVLLLGLLLVSAWASAADYQVPGTTVVLPLIDGLQGEREAFGVTRADEAFPRISVMVMRNLGRDRVFKIPAAYTATINGVEFDFSESVKEKDGIKMMIVIAAAKIGAQALTITGVHEEGNLKDQETVKKTILGMRFGKTLVGSYLEALPISFGVIPELDLVMMLNGAVTLAGKDETTDSAKAMMITPIEQELTAEERDDVLSSVCLQMAEKTFGAKAEDGKLEKTTLGVMPGFRFTVDRKKVAGKNPPGVLYTVAKDGVTLIIAPHRDAGAEEMALFTKQVAKMKTTLKPRK